MTGAAAVVVVVAVGIFIKILFCSTFDGSNAVLMQMGRVAVLAGNHLALSEHQRLCPAAKSKKLRPFSGILHTHTYIQT